MSYIRVTKELSFEMSHALWNYDGACRNIHGHSYVLSITLLGKPEQNPESPKYGMVVDFGDIKGWVKNELVDELDHSLLISSKSDISGIDKQSQLFGKLKVMEFQPTCENLILYIVDFIKGKLPENLKLHSVKLRETATAFAEWHASDNE